MVLGGRALEVEQRGLVLTPVVQQVGEVDARLSVRRIQLQGATQPVEGAALVRAPVGGIADASRSLGRLGMGRDRELEEAPRLVEGAFTEQRAPDLQHQLPVLAQPEGEDAVEAGERARAIPEFQQHLAPPGQGVLLVRVQAQRRFEGPAGPEVLLAGESGVAHAHVQLDRLGIALQALSQRLDRLVVASFGVEPMRAFVVVIGAEERFRHRPDLRGRLCYDKNRRTVTQATGAGYLDR